MKAENNIFQFYDDYLIMISDDIFKSSPEFKVFATKFKAFLDGETWVKDEIDKMIYTLRRRGFGNDEIISRLDLNKNTYYSRIKRITDRITFMILGTERDILNLQELSGIEIPKKFEAKNFVDKDLIVLMSQLLDDISLDFDIYKSCDSKLMTKIEMKRGEFTGVDKDIPSKELQKVLLFLSNYATDTFEAKLNSLDPDVLDFVLNQLSSKRFNIYKDNYFLYKEGSAVQEPLRDDFRKTLTDIKMKKRDDK